MARINGWEWDDRGVDLYDDQLTWFEKEGSVRFAGGAACDQSIEDFLQRGPWVDGVPDGVVSAVTQAIDAIAKK